eukprot:TRINITY_DN2742_c0_g1_i1.p1 TRINITY_DN2742_c0_g1~~TRINITY_DN2742_c0_g1_i1.p1  ORF type:complete len:127 (-),score=14.95 TRINITY_DN2742_c0_g1_i1:90-470(-)
MGIEKEIKEIDLSSSEEDDSEPFLRKKTPRKISPIPMRKLSALIEISESDGEENEPESLRERLSKKQGQASPNNNGRRHLLKDDMDDLIADIAGENPDSHERALSAPDLIIEPTPIRTPRGRFLRT